MAASFVQSESSGSGVGPTSLSVTLASAPTTGNTLFLVTSASPYYDPLVPDGSWTQLDSQYVNWPSDGEMYLYAKTVTAGLSATVTITGGGGASRVTMVVTEVVGSYLSHEFLADDTSGETTKQLPTVTPANATAVLLLGSLIVGHAQTYSSGLSGFTLDENVVGNSGGSSNRHLSFHQEVASASGSYTGTATFAAVVKSGSFLIIIGEGAAPSADFTGTPNPASIGATVTFTDTSVGAPTSWSWTFGDGGVSTDQNPTHVYAAAGSYTVSLTATNASGSDIETKLFYIVVESDPAPGFWMDWVGDGFDDGSGGSGATDPRLARALPQAASLGTASGSDNITAYIMRAEWHRGGSYDHVGSAGPGGFTLFLDNSDGRFDPDNTASPYYGYIKPGVPVWAGAVKTTGALSGSGSVAGFIAGYVREFVPTVDSRGKRVCEVIGEDAFARYQRSIVSVEPSLGRSYATLRGLILDEVGEDSDRRDLATETGMLPFSAVESVDALSVLEELNTATATRHYIRPADTKEDWYDYVTVNKLHKLQAAADQSLTGDDITDISGWRVTNDNVIEVQRASIVPISTTSIESEVWVYTDVPFTVTQSTPRVIWAEFDDYVFDPTLDTTSTGGTLSIAVTTFGKTAKIELWAADATAVTVGRVAILGRMVIRGDTQLIQAGSTAAGARAGNTISSDYIGQTGAAQGLVDFIVWKYGQPLKRPVITVTAKNAATYSTIFERDLFDVLTISVDRLSITTERRAEVIGLRGSVVPGKAWTVSYELQETPNQSAVDWFDVNTDSVNGPKVIAPF